MEFIDQTHIKLKAGSGGDGIVAFRREAHVPLGGPFGGDGGKGGSIIFAVDTHKSTLLDLRYRKQLVAQDGENGKGKKMHGADGEDVIVKVPQGTIVKDHADGRIIADLTNIGQTAVIVSGGKGGRGNFHFKSSRNPAPEFRELGDAGEEKNVDVELKLLADVGLVGFPSVGKSTILSVISAARPQIADYPFTTLVPNLGVVNVGDGRSFVAADLPGLIQGAAEGKGLGHEFLRHIERCRVILHVIDMSGESGRNPLDDYIVINDELKRYQLMLAQRPQLVIANKMDGSAAEANLQAFKQKYPDVPVYPVTALIGEGLKPVIYKTADLLEITPAFPLQQQEEQNVGVVYRYQPPQPGYTVKKLDDTHWIVEGPQIDRLMKQVDLEKNDEAIRFAVQLRKMGVEKELITAGARQTDTVYINDYAFELTELTD